MLRRRATPGSTLVIKVAPNNLKYLKNSVDDFQGQTASSTGLRHEQWSTHFGTTEVAANMENQDSLTQSLSVLIPSGQLPSLSLKERKAANILIADSDSSVRRTMRQTLMSLGFSEIHEVSNPAQALEKLEEKQYQYLIFEARSAAMSSRLFLNSVLELDSKIITIPSSYEPTVDDVFELLIQGARGFIVKPFNSQALDDAIAMATKGDPISDSILYTRSRNEALASLVLASVDRMALILKQARQFETARRELDAKWLSLRKAVEIGKTFAKGGSQGLRLSIVELTVERAEMPRQAIGRVQHRARDSQKPVTLDGDPVISNRPRRKMEKKRKKA